MLVASAPAPVLRVTPMMVLPDIGEALSRYEALGFERVETGSDGCVGLRAGQTGVILASVAFMNDDFDAIHTDRLLDKTIKYYTCRRSPRPDRACRVPPRSCKTSGRVAAPASFWSRILATC